MSDATFKNALLHLGTLIKEKALQAGKVSTSKTPFDEGKAFAYYEVLTLLKECGVIFQIPDRDLGIEGVDPDADLL